MNPWIMASRPKTLMIALAVILLSHSLVWHLQGSLNWTIAALSTLCCFSLQIAVNMANDYFDGLSGIDNEHRLGPLRALQSGLISAKALFTGLIIMTLIAAGSGFVLVLHGGWTFFGLGLLSLLGVFGYSYGRHSIANLALGEIAVFFYFGWLGVLGCFYLQTFELPLGLLFPASELGVLIAAVMLVNNMRDRTTDEDHGKLTLVVRLGAGKARLFYWLLLAIPFVLTVFDPYASGWVFGSIPLALWLFIMIGQRIGKDLNQQLAETSFMVLLWAALYSLGLLL